MRFQRPALGSRSGTLVRKICLVTLNDGNIFVLLLLHAASGHGLVVQQLVEAGANIYARDGSGRTAADLATQVTPVHKT